MRKKYYILLFILSAVIYTLYTSAKDDSGIHPFIKSGRLCADCHLKYNLNIKNPVLANACSVQCLECHKDMKKHHIIDVKITDKLSEKITLSRKKKVMCVSCHDLKSPRYDGKSWKSESLFESVFSRQDKYKTYFLIKRNNDGSLCKICH